eukprot:TRINITY_DN9129_c0_g1_i1.p2 TRINITY_DN9129_c0_g1~~TRINITY_DN9129_c0_g1_i1.p2  ORF type:complete len:196 (+),score=53.11 TRINITY_DN9129_c0_g1_i1:45-590(+)
MTVTHTLLLALFLIGCYTTQASGHDFDKFETCRDCIAAGFGWCPIKRICGGFANRECGDGDRYRKEGTPDKKKKKKKKKKKAAKEQLVTYFTSGNITNIAGSDLFWVVAAQPAEEAQPIDLATTLKHVAKVGYTHSPTTTIQGYFSDKTAPVTFEGTSTDLPAIAQWVYDEIVKTIRLRAE